MASDEGDRQEEGEGKSRIPSLFFDGTIDRQTDGCMEDDDSEGRAE